MGIKDFFTGKTVTVAEVKGAEKEAADFLEAVIGYVKAEDDELGNKLFDSIIQAGLTPSQRMARNSILAKRRNPSAYK